MARFTFEMLDEQCDEIVRQSLREALELQLNSYPEDQELIEALLTVLRYHTAPTEHMEYMIGIENELRLAKETWYE